MGEIISSRGIPVEFKFLKEKFLSLAPYPWALYTEPSPVQGGFYPENDYFHWPILI